VLISKFGHAAITVCALPPWLAHRQTDTHTAIILLAQPAKQIN